MAYKDFLEQVSRYGTRVKTDISASEKKWSNLISLQGDFTNPIETIYDCYPYLFKSLFPNVNDDQIHQLSVAGRLFGASIILFDDFLDKEIKDKNARKLFSPLVMQWEAQKNKRRFFAALKAVRELYRASAPEISQKRV